MKPVLSCIAVLVLSVHSHDDLCSQSFSWVRLGTNALGAARSNTISVDGDGSTYIAGYLISPTHFDDLIVDQGGFLLKYDAHGRAVWGQSLGPIEIRSTAVDKRYGAVYAVGDGEGAIQVRRYTLDGQLSWSHAIQMQEGAPPKGYCVVAAEEGNCYVMGSLDRYAYVGKFDSSGVEIWSRKLTWPKGELPPYWEAIAAALDSVGNLYVATGVTASGPDMRLLKFDGSGRLIWERTDSGYLSPTCISYDGAGHIIAGIQHRHGVPFGDSVFNSTGYGCALVKLDTMGTLVGGIGFGTLFGTGIPSVAVDGNGNVYAVGTALDSLRVGSEFLRVGRKEAFLVKLDRNLNPLRLVGLKASTECYGVTVGGSDIYVTGLIDGGEPSLGGILLEPHSKATFATRLDGTLSVQSATTIAPAKGFATLSPNPFSYSTSLTINQIPIDRIRIHSVDGRLMRSHEGPFAVSTGVNVDFDGLPAGIYYVHLQGRDGTTVVSAIKR